MSGKRRILDSSWSAANVCLATMEVLAQGFEISLAQPVRGYVSTFAFDLKDNVTLPSADGTPIGLVSPNLQPNGTPAWVSPSDTVLTGEGESITAKSSLAVSPFAAQPFRYWQTVPYPQTTPPTTPRPIGTVFQAAANTAPLVVAFYGPDPCQTPRNELASCLAGDGEGGKLNCAPIGKALAACEREYREPQ